MKEILIMQSRRRLEMIEDEQRNYRESLAQTGAQLTFKSTLDESLPWDDAKALLATADGVIFGGSGEFDFDGARTDDDPARLTAHAIRDRVRPFVEYLFANAIPTLGICFGHQIIGEIMGAKVVSDPLQKKVGTHEVRLCEEGKEDPLLSASPESFNGQYGHKDSLSTLPTGAVLLAEAPNCRYSALRYGSNIYTLQFHPELTADEVVRKFANSPGYLPEGVSAESLTRPSKEASALLPRFVNLIV